MRKDYQQQILSLREKGYSYNKIIEEVGCSKSTVSYYLGDSQRAKIKERSQKRRNELRTMLSEIKESSGCVDCGVKYPYYVLDFDHLDDKVDGIGIMIRSHPIEEILKEVKKCEVVCANCHRERTQQRRTPDLHSGNAPVL